VWQVAEITRRIKQALEDQFGLVWVEGEVSNLRRPSSGHVYFTLKDARAQISAVLFKGNPQANRVALKDGLLVRVHAGVSVYEARGEYQLVVRAVEDAGQGSLLEAFERMKKRLAEEGLFDPARKRPLPMLPQHIGIVTSPTGAAVRDMLQVLTRRFPNLHVVVAPVKVQGEQAAGQIARAIGYFNERRDVDVLIVGRGGGSLEDLWAFNEEVVARAVANSAIPVISAVGHEIDFTICDFAADHRAPTPSAAAELVVGRKEDFERAVAILERRRARALQAWALKLRNRVAAAARSYVFREPGNLLRRYRDRIAGRRERMGYCLQSAFHQRQQQVDEWSLRLQHRTESALRQRRHALDRYTAQLRALSPQAVLERGYSVTRGPDGAVVRRAIQLEPGVDIATCLAEGTVTSRVTAIHPGGDHGQSK
jgi:exodeoxyribonuclease VII large subunit